MQLTSLVCASLADAAGEGTALTLATGKCVSDPGIAVAESGRESVIGLGEVVGEVAGGGKDGLVGTAEAGGAAAAGAVGESAGEGPAGEGVKEASAAPCEAADCFLGAEFLPDLLWPAMHNLMGTM